MSIISTGEAVKLLLLFHHYLHHFLLSGWPQLVLLAKGIDCPVGRVIVHTVQQFDSHLAQADIDHHHFTLAVIFLAH